MNVHFIVVVPSLHPPRRLRWGRPLYLCQGGPERRNENCHCHCGHLLVSKAFHSRPGQTSGAPEPSCAAKPPSCPLMPQPDRDGVGRRIYFRALSSRISTTCRRWVGMSQTASPSSMSQRSSSPARSIAAQRAVPPRTPDGSSPVPPWRRTGRCPLGQLQKVFHQPPHLVGHSKDLAGEAVPLRRAAGGVLQQLRVGEDHLQRRFQFMRRVRRELPLLVPGPSHRSHRPPGQQQADAPEGQ